MRLTFFHDREDWPEWVFVLFCVTVVAFFAFAVTAWRHQVSSDAKRDALSRRQCAAIGGAASYWEKERAVALQEARDPRTTQVRREIAAKNIANLAAVIAAARSLECPR